MIAIEKPDILATIQSEGIELKQRGRNFWGLCPFHIEKTASFSTDTERQFFYCFGCHAHGDSISFIQQYKSLSFKDALKHLGISTGKPSPETMQKARHEQRKRDAIKEFKEWCNNYHADLCSLYRCLQIAKDKCRTIKDAEAIADFYHLEPLWIHHMDILEGRDDAAKFELYCEVSGNGK